MAKEKVTSSLVQSIKEDTEQLVTNTKRFGPKLPSKDESSEHDEYVNESLNALNEVICGSFAQLVFGESGKKKLSEISGLIGSAPDNTIFGNIADIAKVLGATKGVEKRTEFAQQFASGFADNKKYWASFENSVKSSIVSSLNESKVNEILIKFQDTKNLSDLVRVIETLGALSLNKTTFKNLEKIKAITEPDGQIAQLLRNFENLNVEAKNVEAASKGFVLIQNLIGSLQKSTTIGPKTAIRFKSNIFWIRHFVIKGLVDTLEELSTINVKTVQQQKSIEIAIKNFNAIFDGLQKISDIGMITALRIHFGLRNIQKLIKTSFKTTLETLAKVLNDTNMGTNNKDLQNTALSQFIKVLNFINNAAESYDVSKMRFILANFKGLLDVELRNLIESLNSEKFNVTKENKKFAALQYNIEQLVNLGEFLPSWIELFAMTAKLEMMPIFVDQIVKLTNKINEMPKSTINKNVWNNLCDKYVGGLIQIATLLQDTDFKSYKKNINDNAIPYVRNVIKFFEEFEYFNGLSVDSNRFKEISKYLKEFSKLPFNELPKQAQLANMLNIETVISQFVDTFKGDAFAAKEDIDIMLTNIRALVMEFSPQGEVGKYLPEMIEITTNDIDKLTSMGKYFDTLAKTAKKLAVIDKLMGNAENPTNTGIVKLANALKEALNIFQDINTDEKKLELLEKSLRTFTKFIVASAAILVFGSLMMTFISVKNLLLFSVTLGAFVWSTLSVFKFIGKQINSANENLESFAMLVVATGTLLVFGSLLFKLIDWGSTLAFVIMTLIFVRSLCAIYLGAQKSHTFENAQDGIYDFVILMTASATVTTIGSLLFKYIDWNDAFSFASYTALFIGTMILAVSWPKLMGGAIGLIPNPIFQRIGEGLKGIDPMKTAMSGMKDFGILLLSAGFTMGLGALIAKQIPFTTLLKFAVNLAGFIVAIMLPFIAIKSSISIAEHTGKEFAKIILMSAATMLIGGLIIKKWPDLYVNIWKFVGIHSAYMFAICGAYWVLNKIADPKSAAKNAALCMIVTLISSATLIYAGYLMRNGDIDPVEIAIFTGCVLGYITIFALISKLINKFSKDLLKSVLAFALLSVATMAATYALSCIAEMAKKYTWEDFGEGALELLAGIVVLGAAYAGIGLIMPGIAIPLVAAAIGIVTISGLTILTVTAMSQIADNLSKIETFNTNTNTFITAIGNFAKLGEELADKFFGVWMLKLPFVSGVILTLNLALLSMVSTIKSYASLEIPTSYDANGKPKGYRKMSTQDFNDAANNIKAILVAIGDAINHTVSTHKEIFGEPGVFSSDPKDSPAYRAAIAIGEMVKPISRITKVLGYYAKGEFPVSPNAETTNTVNFIKVGENIENVLTAIGRAITGTVEKHKEIFGKSGLVFSTDPTDSPAYRAAIAISEIVNPISSITKVLGYYMTDKFPTAFNANGTVKSTISATDENVDKAQNNIEKILLAIVNPFAHIIDNESFKKIFKKQRGSTVGSLAAENILDLSDKVVDIVKKIDKLNKYDLSSIETNVKDKQSNIKTAVQGLKEIIAEVNKIDTDTDKFDNTSDFIKKYVENVNKIDLSRVNAIINLTSMLSSLIEKLGNLDKLSNSFARELALILDKLVTELSKADETIKTADKLQERRHELIRQATQEVKTIMDQKMLVEIRQVQDMTSANSGGSSSSSSTSRSQSSPSISSGSYSSSNSGGASSSYTDGTSNSKSVAVNNGGKSTLSSENRLIAGNSNGSQISSGTLEEAILRALRRAHDQKLLS